MQRQPKTFKLSLRALLSLPYRLLNPPSPVVGKVRTCGVTPVYKVELDDILSRKHLPPLGLKDFEEWLLYVEQSVENLYFLLWLEEYTVRYDHWAQPYRDSKPAPSTSTYRAPSSAPPASTSLALFYSRAKQTFLTSNAPYELNVPSDLLSPFYTTMASSSQHASPARVHPDPAVFGPLAADVREMLARSLDRFVLAAYTNVGTYRAVCGMIGGCVIALAGAVPPLVCAFAEGRPRWLRLVAFPGMWLGVMIYLASVHGVCLMVYIFGDLRQLRRFELARPPISRPQALSIFQPSHPQLSALPPQPITRQPRVPLGFTPFLPGAENVPPVRKGLATIPERSCSSSPSRPSSYASSSSSSGSCTSSGSQGGGTPTHTGRIHISPAYYDEEPTPGSGLSPVARLAPPYVSAPSSEISGFQFPLMANLDTPTEEEDDGFVPSAPFIHAYHDPCAGLGGEDGDSCERGEGHGSGKLEDDDDGELDFFDTRAGMAGLGGQVIPSPSASSFAPQNQRRPRRLSAADRQAVDAFDFDALPPRPRLRSSSSSLYPPPFAFPASIPPGPSRSQQKEEERWGAGDRWSMNAILGFIQYKCVARLVVVPKPPALVYRSPVRRDTEKDTHPSPLFPPSVYSLPQPRSKGTEKEKRMSSDTLALTRTQRLRLRLILAVPAFAAPLTRVLSPVIARAQWEIVVRSAVLAFLLCWVVVGCFMAVPVTGHGRV